MNVYSAAEVTAASKHRLRLLRSIATPVVVAGSLILAGAAPGAWAAEPGPGTATYVPDEALMLSEVDPPVAIRTHAWPLAGHTDDVVDDAHMSLTGTEGIDYTWTEDRFCFPERALALTGTGQAFASTTGPVVTTEDSFSVAAWSGLVSLADHPQTVLSQAGRVQPAMRLQVTPDGPWRFTVRTRNPDTGLGVAETEPGSVQLGVWNHLVGVLDLFADEVVGDAHMTLAGAEGSDYTWTDDRFCLPGRALALAGTGQGFASTTGAVLTTEESFSVNAWAGLPSLTGHPQTVLSQAGRVQPAMCLQATPDGRWRFTVPTRNPYDDLGVAETEPGAVRVGV